MKTRRIIQIIEGVKTIDGAGVHLTRLIGAPDLKMLDPFLLFDEFGTDNPDDYIAGFPSHPHRGFQLWLNLPKERKMIAPAYQDIHMDQIPTVMKERVRARVISGQYEGITGPGKSHTSTHS